MHADNPLSITRFPHSRFLGATYIALATLVIPCVASVCGGAERTFEIVTAVVGDHGDVSRIAGQDELSINIMDSVEKVLKGLSEQDREICGAIHDIVISTPSKDANALQQISSLHSLRTIDVCVNGWVPQLSIAVQRLERLEQIWAESAGVNAKDLTGICRVRTLRVLMVGGNPLRTGDLDILQELKNMRQLSLAGIDLKESDLKFVANMQYLRWLDLRKTQVGDSSIPAISRCKELQFLTLTGTTFSDDGVAELRRLLPMTIIVFSKRDNRPVQK